MNDDNKVIDIYDWHRPRKPGELPRGCALGELSTPPQTDKPRKLRLSEKALAVTLAALAALLVASYV